MAGFFERIVNVWRGWLGLKVSQAEANNPEAVYESAIEERIKKHREQEPVSGIVYLRNKPGQLEQKTKRSQRSTSRSPSR